MVYIYLHLVYFYGKCRKIYHAWMVWVWVLFDNPFYSGSSFLSSKDEHLQEEIVQ